MNHLKAPGQGPLWFIERLADLRLLMGFSVMLQIVLLTLVLWLLVTR